MVSNAVKPLNVIIDNGFTLFAQTEGLFKRVYSMRNMFIAFASFNNLISSRFPA